MPRFARVVAVDSPHHVTQRGNASRMVFETDSDRLAYLSLLREFTALYRLSVLGYCLMPNHVHLIAVPHQAQSLAKVLEYAHGRYAAYLNARQGLTGHVWQGRYYSCPMDENHFWTALRYVERNPVRAGMVDSAEGWAWSSARAHCGGYSDGLVDLEMWRARWNPLQWREFLSCGDAQAEQIRQYTHNGRPLGSTEFIRALERALGRTLLLRKVGRPMKPVPQNQQALPFAAGQK